MTASEQQAVLDRATSGDNQALGRLFESFRPYVRLVVRSIRLCPIRDVGELDGVPYAVMALVEGGSFAGLNEVGSLKPPPGGRTGPPDG